MKNTTLFDELNQFSGSVFREYYKQYLYIHCRDLLEIMFPGELKRDITGVFAYCYIDKDEGISFRPTSLAALTDYSILTSPLPHKEDTIYILRLRTANEKMNELHQNGRHMYLYALDPNKSSFLNSDIIHVPEEHYADLKRSVDKTYDAGLDVEELRSKEFSFLDPFRHEIYPDDVRALLYTKENGIEEVWVRLIFANGKELFGSLLNEPYKDYGCHEGTVIGLVMGHYGEEEVLVFNGRTASFVN